MRKPTLALVAAACVLLNAAVLMAGKIYHWTDESGHDYITEDPPPSDGQLKETIEYTPQPVVEQTGSEEQRSVERKTVEQEKLMQTLATAQKRAAEARIRAREAQAAADELDRRAAEFKATKANTNYRRMKNKSIVIRLENDALEAKKMALKAEEEAREAEAKALQIEKEVAETMLQSEAESNGEPLPKE
jgi:hypothetical protein